MKRQHISDDYENKEFHPAEKLARMDTNGRAVPRREVALNRIPTPASSVSHDRPTDWETSDWGRTDSKEQAYGTTEVDRHSRPTRGRSPSSYRAVDRQRLRSISPLGAMPRHTPGHDAYAISRQPSNGFDIDRVGQSSRQADLSRDSSPPRRVHSSRASHQADPYDEYREDQSMRKTYAEKYNAGNPFRPSSDYQEYQPNHAYEHHQYVSSSGRARGRGRGMYFHTRGGYKPMRNLGGQFVDQPGSQSLNLRAGS